jgi:hypothetical protein
MHVRCHDHSNFFPRRTSKYWAWKNLFLRMISTYFCNFSMLFSHYFHLSMSSDLGMWLMDLCHDLSKPLQSPNDQNQQQTKQWYIERHYANNNNCFLSNQNGHAGSYHISSDACTTTQKINLYFDFDQYTMSCTRVSFSTHGKNLVRLSSLFFNS